MFVPSNVNKVDTYPLLLAADSNDSAAQITNHIVGDYKDLETVKAFAQQCDVVTFEHELIPLSIIKSLEAEGVVVRPSSASFLYSQDKAAMREKLSSFPAPKFQVVTDALQVTEFPVSFITSANSAAESIFQTPRPS